VVFVAGALLPHPHKELSFLDLDFGVPLFQKGDEKSVTTQNTKAPIFFVAFLERLMCKVCAKWDAVPHPAKGVSLLKPFVFKAVAKKQFVKVLVELFQKLMGLSVKP
jgi:hypothetical protein